MNKLKLLEEICEWYNYDVRVDEERVVVDNWTSDYGLEFVGKRVECGHFEYDNMDEALKDWLSTLEESNKDYLADEGIEYGTWDKEVIDFIKSL